MSGEAGDTGAAVAETPEDNTDAVVAGDPTSLDEPADKPKPKKKKKKPPQVASPTPASMKNCCAGQNDCKGLGGCKTGQNACMGKNMCKGQGGCKTGLCQP